MLFFTPEKSDRRLFSVVFLFFGCFRLFSFFRKNDESKFACFALRFSPASLLNVFIKSAPKGISVIYHRLRYNPVYPLGFYLPERTRIAAYRAIITHYEQTVF